MQSNSGNSIILIPEFKTKRAGMNDNVREIPPMFTPDSCLSKAKEKPKFAENSNPQQGPRMETSGSPTWAVQNPWQGGGGECADVKCQFPGLTSTLIQQVRSKIPLRSEEAPPAQNSMAPDPQTTL